MIDVDLPSLQSFTLGLESLYGSDDESCSLTMRSKNDLICRSSMSNIH